MIKYALALVLLTLELSPAKDRTIADSLDDDQLRTGILYGDDHVFSLTAPSGWILDNTSGVSQGLHAVFYPVGGSWQNSKAVMYAKGSSKDLAKNQTIQDFMSYDSAQFVAHRKPARIVDAAPITLADGRTACVRRFLYSQNEIIAYIDEPKIVAMIILTARSSDDCQAAVPQFYELVKSYSYLGDNQLKKVTDFQTALKAADKNLTTSSGKQYDDEVGRCVAKWLGLELQNSISDASSSDLASFTVLICLDHRGRALEVLTQPSTLVSKRVKPAFSAVSYPRPPAACWWVKVNVGLKSD